MIFIIVKKQNKQIKNRKKYSKNENMAKIYKEMQVNKNIFM